MFDYKNSKITSVLKTQLFVLFCTIITYMSQNGSSPSSNKYTRYIKYF